MSDFIDADTVMAKLKLSRSALYSMVRRGVIPCLRLGRTLRFRAADIEAMVA